MIKNKLFFIIFLLGIFSTSMAQEGLAPLWGNEKLMLSKKQTSSFKVSKYISYSFTLDTNHLPIIDDFSRNFFKKYDWDTANTILDTVVWFNFLSNNQWQERLDAMNDTSYTYQKNGTEYDSTANPVLYVVKYSQTINMMAIDTDTVWVRPDTTFLGNTVVTTHDPDITYFNYLDSNVIVPDIGYSVWKGSSALHNYTYGIDPITLGVATFDGLDSNGVPYDPSMNPNSYQIADVLESKPIYLSTKKSGGSFNPASDTGIWLSFYYQPQGYGDAPESGDSLILQFYSPLTKKWKTKWKEAGVPLQPFRSVSLNIREPEYFLDGFKFRFLNYASVSGNFDHWHIDYVRLDELRTQNDTTSIDDVGLLDAGESLLTEYSQMPWLHYKSSTKNLMKSTMDLRYRNLYNTSTSVVSSFDAYEDGTLIFSGSQNTSPIVNPFAIVAKPSTLASAYPKTNTDTTHSFNLKYWIQPGSDTNTVNDTAYFHQQFGTQYAYDDGSAESAYFVTSSGASIAVEYNIEMEDTLKAINIYFPRSYENIKDRSYRLMVWSSLSPEVVLYEGYLDFPVYSAGRDVVQGIKLEEPLVVSGTIFIGVTQTDKRIFIGLDRNNDNQYKNYYRINGAWSNSSYTGSLFIRPEFGDFTNQWPVSVEQIEPDEFDFNVYPNPSSSTVNVALTGNDNTVILRSILGVIVRQFSASDYLTFDVSGISTGLYLVEVTDNITGKSKSKKLLIQH